MSTDCPNIDGRRVYGDEKGLFAIWENGAGYEERVDVAECHICERLVYQRDALEIHDCYLCGSCADTIMNLEHHRRAGSYITWPNPPKQGHRRREITAGLRRKVHERDFYACRYCGARQNLVVDHLVPVSRGGKNTLDNLVTACRTCNLRKLNRSLEDVGLTLHPPDAFAP